MGSAAAWTKSALSIKWASIHSPIAWLAGTSQQTETWRQVGGPHPSHFSAYDSLQNTCCKVLSKVKPI